MAARSTSIPAFPLKWPAGVPRTEASARERSKFGKTDWNASLANLRKELALLGAEYVTLSTNMRVRNDGEPYAQVSRIDDPGVAVYFTLDGVQVCFPCDRWISIAENFRAVTLHIEAMRGQQRWGVGTVKQAFAGYKALTATAGENEDWWFVLGILSTATVEQIKTAHRELALKFHTDRGGTHEQMARINTARDRALAERNGNAGL